MKVHAVAPRLGLALVAAVASASSAQTEDISARAPLPFASYGTDDNGRISQQEFEAVAEQRQAARAQSGAPMRGAANAPSFAEFDSDGDGTATAQELTANQAQRPRSSSPQ